MAAPLVLKFYEKTRKRRKWSFNWHIPCVPINVDVCYSKSTWAIMSLRSVYIVRCMLSHIYNSRTITFTRWSCFQNHVSFPFLSFLFDFLFSIPLLFATLFRNTCSRLSIALIVCLSVRPYYLRLTFHFHSWPFVWLHKRMLLNNVRVTPLLRFDTWPWINDGYSHSIRPLSFVCIFFRYLAIASLEFFFFSNPSQHFSVPNHQHHHHTYATKF